jgi:hypothetical protein
MELQDKSIENEIKHKDRSVWTPDCIDVLAKFLAVTSKTKRPSNSTAYVWKHRVDSWTRKVALPQLYPGFYMFEADFIEQCKLLGVQFTGRFPHLGSTQNVAAVFNAKKSKTSFDIT